MATKYSMKGYNKETMARALGISLPISFKQSIEICDFIRNKEVNYARNILNKVINKEFAIPFKKFNMNMGHKKNIASGRFPKNASIEFLNLIGHVEANAQFKGLNTSNLVITNLIANKSSSVVRYGRKRNRKAKRTNVEIVVKEKSIQKESRKISDKRKETKK